MPQTISFGEWLKRRRKSLDLTRDEFARRVPCSASAVWRLETNDLRPSPTLAASLARVLDIPAAQHADWIAFARGECDAPPDVKPDPSVSASRAHVLPAPLTQFIGRKREVAALVDLMRQPSVRLLTLTGPPGTGKTRLSLAVGQKLSRVFSDGVYFVALESIHDPHLVGEAIAHTLGIHESRGGILQSLIELVRDKKILLILDNFEHLVPAAPILSELLIGAPQVKALVTSRELLHLYGEHEFPVPPLEIIDAHHLPTSQSLALYSRYASIQFFKERARAAKHNFRLTTENVADIARICAWLDGLPLAIEIAAAQIRWHSPRQLLAQLQNRMEALTGGPRDLSPRQQSLQGAIDWSYQLLDDDEQRLFNWLGIFWGGCEDQAIAEIGDQKSMTGEKIQNLVEKNLVRRELDADDHPRYTMLETLRDYARAKLAQGGEWERARQWHAEYYLKFAQAAYTHWRQSGDQARWLNRIEREHNNLRAALTWSLETPARATLAQNLGIALGNFWYIRGYLTEGRRWLEQILAVDTAPSAARARILSRASEFAAIQGDYVQAIEQEESSLAISKSLQDQEGIFYSLDGLAVLAGRRGDFAKTAELLEQVLAYRRQSPDLIPLTGTLNNLANAYRRLNHLERAKQLYAESIGASRSVNNSKSLSHALHGLGEIHIKLKEYQLAISMYRDALKIRQQLGDRRGIQETLDSLALTLQILGFDEIAAQLEGAVEKIQTELNISPPSPMRQEHENFIARLRANLGDQAFECAYAKGQTLAIDQIIALAMQNPP